ncbi:MAG: ABC transporter permease [Gemmatimonadota bacterium]
MSRWPFTRSLRPGQVRADTDEDIREEIELYLELRAQELETDEGLSPGEARREAEERFGARDRVAEELRKEAGRRRMREGRTMTMQAMRQDVAFAARTLWRSPGFSLVAVVTLALAVGGNTAIFSVVDAALLQALPFEDHEQLVFVNGVHDRDGELAVRGASYPEFRDWESSSTTVPQMAALRGFSAAISGEGGEGSAERITAELVTEQYFDVLGAQPALGRLFQPDEYDISGPRPVVVISDAFFERRFDRDPGAVGRDLWVNDQRVTVIGVMPADFGGVTLATELWAPQSMIALVARADIVESRGSRFLTVVGRLGGEVAPDAAQEELDAVSLALQERYPRAHEDRFAQLQEFRQGYLGTTGQLLWVLFGAGAVLLLIAAANVANLFLVRSHARTRELVLRRALGAAGSRIAGQLMVESFTLAFFGAVTGLAVAWLALQYLTPLIPAGVLPGYVDATLSVTAFVFSLFVLALVGLLVGLVPAASSARIDIATRLREGARSASGGGLKRLRPQHFFVVTQVALALVLLVGAGLMTRSFRAQLLVDTGAEMAGVTAMSLQLPRARYDTDESILAFTAELERRLSAIPGVTTTSISSDLPFRNGSSGAYIFRQGDGPEDRIRYHRHSASPGFFETLGVEVLRGRALDASDVEGRPTAIVITETMEGRVFPGENAVGKTMYLRPDGTLPVEVVGVVEDIRFRDVTTSLLADANSPDVFFSLRQRPSLGLEAAVRTALPADAVIPQMRSVVAELDPDLPAFDVGALEDAWREQTAVPRFAAFLMTLFSAVAALLSAVGIYGVLAFAVGERSREIAIRRAVGATGGAVARTVVGDGLKLAGVGLLAGIAFARLATGVLESFLFGVEVSDPLTFVSVGTGMVAFALAAAAVPALRASRRDPSDALNLE